MEDNLLKNYFDTLASVGSVKQCETNSILTYICIQNFLNSGLFIWANEDDINIMGALINNVKNKSCFAKNFSTAATVMPYARVPFVRPLMDITEYNELMMKLYKVQKENPEFFDSITNNFVVKEEE